MARRMTKHSRAVRSHSGNWKRRRNRAALLLTLENPGYEVSDEERRIFTTTEKLPGRALVLRGRGGRRIPLTFAGKPVALRPALVRIKKLWKVRRRGGVRKRPPPNPSDPPGFESVFSKPTRVVALEKGTAQCELLFPASKLRSTQIVEMTLRGFKKYEGPLPKNRLDLQAGCAWTEISPIIVIVSLPPEGTTVPGPVEDLLAPGRPSNAAEGRQRTRLGGN